MLEISMKILFQYSIKMKFIGDVGNFDEDPLFGLIPGARPTHDISIELEIQWNFVMQLFIVYSTDHNEILHTSQQ